MEEILLFFMCFCFVLVIYELFIIPKAKNKKNKKLPIEVKYLISRYKFDLDIINYKQLLQVVALISSLDISIVVSCSLLIDGYIYQLLLAIVLSIPIILISYHFVGILYKKKGMKKNV